jgi:membrane protein DedA with SNARE-associated domain
MRDLLVDMGMDHIQDIVTHYHYLGLFLLLVFGGLGLPFPEDATLILCGVLIATGVVRLTPAVITVYAGVLAADLALYYIGYRFGRQVIERRGFRKVITPARIEYIEDKFRRRGVLLILVGRHIVGLRVQLIIVAGIMRMKAWRFLLADSVSAVFTVAALVFVGYKGGESINVLKRDITRVEHIVAVIAVAGFIIYLFYKHFQTRSAADGK